MSATDAMADPAPHPVADAHSDLLMELVHAELRLGEPDPLRGRWRAQLAAGGVALQVCAIYADPAQPADAALRAMLAQARSFHRAVEANAGDVVAVRRAADLDRLDDRLGLLLAIEGVAAFGEDGWLIDTFADLGVRMASLTWNERNPCAGGCATDAGLTPLGARTVARMAERGLAIDLAHASPRTFADVLERAPRSAAVLVSHAGCRALRDHPRNLTDGQLTALAARGGVVGLMPHPLVVDPAAPTLERFLDHVDHAVAVAGVAHVGLGGDFVRQVLRTTGGAGELFDGVRADAVLDGLAGPADWPRLLRALAARGYGDEAIAAIAGGNLLRLLRAGLPAAPPDCGS